MNTNYKPSQSELDRARAWADNMASDPPFGFKYNGEGIAPMLRNLAPRAEKRTDDGKYELRTLIWELEDITVRCEIELNLAFPEAEWTVWLENPHEADTGRITEFFAVDAFIAPDMLLPHPGINHTTTLTHYNGDYYSPDGFEQFKHYMRNGVPFVFRNSGGRSTNLSFPYYSVGSDKQRVSIAVSWQGQWETAFGIDWQKGVHMKSGQQYFDAYLKKGEKVRSPLVALMFFDEPDYCRAMNLWRAWGWERNVPQYGGAPLGPKHSFGSNGCFYEAKYATEENQLYFINKYFENNIRMDYWWIDAMWFELGTEEYPNWCPVGTWEPDRKRFPNGFAPLAKRLADCGGGVMAWFEPERASPGTYLYENRREWLLSTPAAFEALDGSVVVADEASNIDNSLLLNLADEGAVEWLTGHINKIIKENCVAVYRQDFNMNPLRFWRHNDEAGREGVLENKYCQGYLRYWDGIIAANPGIVIDTCASGGRRMELETLRRSVPIHKTDYTYSDYLVKAALHQSLLQWVPYFGASGNGGDIPVNQYMFVANFAAWFAFEYDMRRDGIDFAPMKALLALREDLAHCLYGDFVPLLPYSRDRREWLMWQFDSPGEGDGIVVAIARDGSAYRSAVAKPLFIDPAAQYEVRTIKDFAYGEPAKIKGDALAGGWLFEAGEFPQGMILYYKKLQVF